MKNIKIIVLSVLSVLMLQAAHAQSGVILPVYYQSQSNWCWATSSQMIYAGFKGYKSQCYFVTRSRDLENKYYSSCNNIPNYSSTACQKPSWYNKPQTLFGCNGSTQQVLSSYGIPTYSYNSALSASTLEYYTKYRRLFIASWGWKSGGGHAVVINQYKWGHVGFNDPLKGRNVWKYSTFKTANGRGTWRRTLRTKYGATRGGNYGLARSSDQGPNAYQLSLAISPENHALDVYPNPSSSQSTIRFNADRTETAKLSITDMLGKVIYENEITADMQFLDLDLSNWAKGAYLIRMQNTDEVQKLLVQ